MSPFELLSDLRRRPFEPFRLYVSDGTVYEVRHPELCLVGVGSVMLGIATDPNSPIYEKTVRVSLNHIVKQEPIHPNMPPERELQA